ncbi:Synaptic vesicle glycoprotein 2B [Eumeta japonica]|uniref:Synaptic vesicle glycoprotein 2B n=1 Tax=Eumeta variegata TaxID=151549 RepID=A0A4C1URA7_EUMVA|nr:Synaptic vesicle glycoprotein 2B [Eumeta japonica]
MKELRDKPEIEEVEKGNAVKEEEKKTTSNKQGLCTLEEALEIAGTGRYSYVLFAISAYSLMSSVAELFGIGLLTTAAQCDLELNSYRKGLISSVPVLGIIASGHLWGYIADTNGRKFTLSMTMAGTFLMSVISSFSFNWIVMALTKFTSALFASGTFAVIYTLLGESVPQSKRAKFLLYNSTGIMLSHAFMATIAYPILSLSFVLPIGDNFAYRPWRLLAQTYAMMSGVNLMLLLNFIYESPKYYLSKNKHEEGIAVLAKIYTANTGNHVDEFPVQSVLFEEEVVTKKSTNFFNSIWAQTVPLLKKKYIKNTLLIFYTSSLVYTIGPAIVIWLPDILNAYVNNMHRLNEDVFCGIIQSPREGRINSTISTVTRCDDHVKDLTLGFMAANGLFLFFLTLILNIIIKCIGKRWTYIGVHLVCAAAAFSLNFVKSFASVLFFISMMSNGVCVGITTTYSVEVFPTYLRVIELYSVLILTGGAVVGYFLPSDKKESKKALKAPPARICASGAPLSLRALDNGRTPKPAPNVVISVEMVGETIFLRFLPSLGHVLCHL